MADRYSPGWAACKAGDEIVDEVILIDDIPGDKFHDQQGLVETWMREHLRTGAVWIGGIRIHDDGRIEHHPDVNPGYLPTIVEEDVITIDGSRFRVTQVDGDRTLHLEPHT